MLEICAHRTRLIKTMAREEKYAKLPDRQRVFKAWNEVSKWIAGHRRPTHEPLDKMQNSDHVLSKEIPDTKYSGTRR